MTWPVSQLTSHLFVLEAVVVNERWRGGRRGHLIFPKSGTSRGGAEGGGRGMADVRYSIEQSLFPCAPENPLSKENKGHISPLFRVHFHWDFLCFLV